MPPIRCWLWSARLLPLQSGPIISYHALWTIMPLSFPHHLFSRFLIWSITFIKSVPGFQSLIWCFPEQFWPTYGTMTKIIMWDGKEFTHSQESSATFSAVSAGSSLRLSPLIMFPSALLIIRCSSGASSWARFVAINSKLYGTDIFIFRWIWLPYSWLSSIEAIIVWI